MEPRRSRKALIACLALAALLGASSVAEAAVCSVTNRADLNVQGTLRWCVGRVNAGVDDEIDIDQSGIYHLETALQIDRDVDVEANVAGVLIQPGEAFSDDTLIRVGCGTLACDPVVRIAEIQVWSGLASGWRGIDVRPGSVLTLEQVLMADFDSTLDGGALRAQGETLVHLIDSEFQGNRGARGGAVFSSGTLLEVTGSRFDDNRASSGGGAIHFRMSPFILVGQLEVDDSDFVDNFGTASGGAIHVTGSASVISASVTASRFSGNQAASGGAIDGFADVTKSTFSANRADVGGALSLAGTSQVLDSLFTNNVAFQGGGIAFRTTSSQLGVTLRGSTLGRNDFSRQNGSTGAGVFLSGGTHLIENTTLSANGAPGTVMAFATTGGGVALVAGASLELRHATLAGNAADSGAGIHVNSVSQVAVNSSIVASSPIGPDCTFLGASAQTTSLSPSATCSFTYRIGPLLGPLAANGGPTPTHMPASGSPAIDRGTCFSSVDQRGMPRPGLPNTLCDIGSVEAR